MKDSEVVWLKEIFPYHKGKTIRGETYVVYLEAERILKGRESVQKRTCSCQYRGLAEEVNRLHNNWLHKNEVIHVDK